MLVFNEFYHALYFNSSHIYSNTHFQIVKTMADTLERTKQTAADAMDRAKHEASRLADEMRKGADSVRKGIFGCFGAFKLVRKKYFCLQASTSNSKRIQFRNNTIMHDSRNNFVLRSSSRCRRKRSRCIWAKTRSARSASSCRSPSL